MCPVQNELVFAAIADPTRREILRRLDGRPSEVEGLAAGFRISRPAVSKHLAALLRAGLVTRTARGRTNIYATDPAPLVAVREWLDHFWGDRLALLKRMAEGDA